MKLPIIGATIFCLIAFSLKADPYISGEFIYNLDGEMRNPFDPELSIENEKEIIRKMLEEARWVFSGMIYGFDIVYTPSDISRSVPRYYKIEPIGEIRFGDKYLEIVDTFLENRILHLFIRYKLDEYQKGRIEYWNSEVFTSSSAYGESLIFNKNSRIKAIEDAMRLSLESLLKPEVFNKPSLIEAQVLIRSTPYMSLNAGHNRAFVKLRVAIKNVQYYGGNN